MQRLPPFNPTCGGNRSCPEQSFTSGSLHGEQRIAWSRLKAHPFCFLPPKSSCFPEILHYPIARVLSPTVEALPTTRSLSWSDVAICEVAKMIWWSAGSDLLSLTTSS